jgi:hypothetical protein
MPKGDSGPPPPSGPTRFIDLPLHGSSASGWLSVAQSPFIPFTPRRAYWIWGVPASLDRGAHAHKELVQLLISFHGRVNIRTLDPDGRKEEFLLDNPRRGLLLAPQYWHTMMFGHGAILLCLASQEFDEKDYIRKIDEFYQYWRQG